MKAQATQTKAQSRRRGLPNLRLWRQRRGLSIGQLADMTGLRRTTIAHLEDGREEPQPYQVRLLARVLEISQLELVS
ncbi:helix-turn-helix transcriptional regulator [Thermogemmatispora sp.]|uniref:helix-turn-helix transcriptional regulator n=1 Tax=Thermogemmatispora sp. TaxID=1968838 RepID=UPI001D20DBAA|nr:helix-turn-helix transcriptional regulator [Thermogemmatispora sp.]MBX5449882.1 helix-turn-helix transcriptional regulator [Thermogemmatispora sp.]